MPKYPHQKESKNSLKKFTYEIAPFLNFQLKNELTLGFSDIFDIKKYIEKNKKLIPSGFYAKLTDFHENTAKILTHLNELTTMMSLLKEVKQNYFLQPQKIYSEEHFLPIIEKYRTKAQIQGIDFNLYTHFSEKPISVGKVEFEHILELILSNTLKKAQSKAIDIILEINDTKLLFLLSGIRWKSQTYSVTKNEAYKHPQETFEMIQIYLVQKLVEKLNGSITFEDINEIHIEIPIESWKKA